MKRYVNLYSEFVIAYGLWLLLIVIWNYGYPKATPFLDVTAAVLFAIFNIMAVKKLKFLKEFE